MAPFSKSLLVVAGCLVLIGSGCGPNDVTIPSPQNVVQEQVTDSVEALRKRLEIIRETGEGGSVLEGVRESIEKNVTNDQAKAAMLKDFDKLNASMNAEQNKKIAERMLKALNS